MWKSIQFARTTVVGGFFIVLPIALAAIILTYMVDIVERADVERIEAGTSAALNCMMQWGIGAREILTRRQ